jgi:hypothetical protein
VLCDGGEFFGNLPSAVLQGSIYWKIPLPPWGGEKISADVIWGKNMRRPREKAENVERKEERGKKMRKRDAK